VARDDLVAYNERYARRLTPDIRFGNRIEAIRRDSGGWRVATSLAEYWSPWVVVALGLNAIPHMPPWPGMEEFSGDLLHAFDFQRAADYAGKEVLVVGAGASGTDIAVQVVKARARRVWLSIRTPPLILRRHVSTAVMSQMMKEGRRPPRFLVDRVGIVIHRLLWGDMSRYGLYTPTEGLATGLERRGHGSTVDRGLVSAVRCGHIKVLPAVDRFDGADVVLTNGDRVQPHAVIAATGQRTGLRRLLGDVDVLRDNERPKVHAGSTHPTAPGLYFLGYRLPAGQLLDMRFDAPAIARDLSRLVR
jgi:putative flavoprotein involved in K+ transport